MTSITIQRGARTYTITGKQFSGELRYVVNWREPGRQGVIGGLYSFLADAERAIPKAC